MEDPLYIHGLRAENYMRLELVELGFNGAGLEIITGDNGEGKSSLLNSILVALGGKEMLPDKPVREGAESSEIAVDLGDKVIRVHIKPDRSQTLTVESKDGARYGSPQKLLNEMISSLTFDPLAFATMETRKQAETLRHLIGLDTTAVDTKLTLLYGERREANRDMAHTAGYLQRLRDAAPSAIENFIEGSDPQQFIDITRVSEEHQAATKKVMEHQSCVTSIARALGDIEAFDNEIVTHRAGIEALEKKIKALEERKDKAKGYIAEMEIKKIRMEPLPSTDDLTAKLKKVQAHNARVEYMATVAAADADAKLKKERHDAADEAYNAALEAKARMLDSVAFPVEGLGLADDVVTFKGIPLSQASSAEQIRVCLAITAALNPALRTILVHQGNDLDQKRLRMVAEWAKEKGYQVIMERVAGESPVGIVIEAGKVKEDCRENAPPAPALKKERKAKKSGEVISDKVQQTNPEKEDPSIGYDASKESDAY